MLIDNGEDQAASVRLDDRVHTWKVSRHQLARILADAVTTRAWIGQTLTVSPPPQS
jgi:hypothetical protein